jgi:ABC-type Na+ efflux pump permease subunit
MAAPILIRLILLEARRGGLPWLAAAAVLAALALAGFVSEVALAEGRMLQASVMAALLRACAVFLVAAQVVTSVVREINDRGLEMMLSLPVARPSHYAARLAGFALVGAALAVIFAVPLFLVAPPAAVLAWCACLALESALVAAAALFFAMTLAQVVPAIAATAGLYLLARSMAAIQAIAAGGVTEPSFAHTAARYAIDLIAFVLPRLDAATRSEWLVYGAPGPGEFLAVLGALALYVALLTVAGLVDFQRRAE